MGFEVKLNATLAISAIALLAACGGGSSGASNFQTLGNQGFALINKHQNANATTVQGMPVGTFNYSGVAAYSTMLSSNADTILDNALAVSSIDLTANFREKKITGQLSNFVDSENYTASGSIPLSGAITANGFTSSGADGFTAQGSGILVSSFDNSDIFTSANISGGFFGSQANVASGLMTASYGGISVRGVFVAER